MNFTIPVFAASVSPVAAPSSDSNLKPSAKDSLNDSAARQKTDVPIEKLQESLNSICLSLDKMLQNVPEGAHGFSINEIEVSLAISAEVGFVVVNAGVEAAVTLHLTR